MAEDYDYLDIHYEQMELNAGDYIDIHANNSIKLFASGTECRIKPNEMNFTANGNINLKANSAGIETTCQVKGDGFYVNGASSKIELHDTDITIANENLNIKFDNNTITFNATNKNIHLLAIDGYVIIVGNVIINNQQYVPIPNNLLIFNDHLQYYSSYDMIEIKSRNISFRREDGSTVLYGKNNTSLKVNPDSIEIKSPDGKVDITGDVYVNNIPMKTISISPAVKDHQNGWAGNCEAKVFGKVVCIRFGFWKLTDTPLTQDTIVATLADAVPKPPGFMTFMANGVDTRSAFWSDSGPIPMFVNANFEVYIYRQPATTIPSGKNITGSLTYIID
jgi:hypothetical protein